MIQSPAKGKSGLSLQSAAGLCHVMVRTCLIGLATELLLALHSIVVPDIQS